MTNPNNLTPPPELVQQWRDTTTMKTVLEIGTSQAPPDEVMVNSVRYVPATDAPATTPDPAPTAGFWERHTMGVCPVCGNKRCPKAADPAMTCTGSNEPGQPGSAYANPAPTADDRGKLGGAIHAGTVTTHTITKSPDPAPTEGVPLWELMQKAHDKAATNRGGYAAEMRAVADQIQQQFQDREGILELGVRGVVAWLRAEADLAEAGEDSTP